MKAEQQRICIAEACGWVSKPDKYYYDRIAWNHPSIKTDRATQDLPSYLTDLNAMHEAEKVFYSDSNQSVRYAEFLLDVLQIPHPFIGTARCAFLTNHATAAQRAEAFLRTIGKWTDSK